MHVITLDERRGHAFERIRTGPCEDLEVGTGGEK